MFRLFEGQTADEAWQRVAAVFREDDSILEQSSRGGMSKEILHAAISIIDPRQRWVVSRQPAINPAFALAEVVWIVTGRNDSAFLNYFNRDYPKYAGNGDTYHGAYGYRLRRSLGIDQLDRGYQALRGKPDSRQVVLQLWDSRFDFPNANGSGASPDIPCNIVSMLKVRDGKLEWTQIIRSNDIYRGLPYNFVQFTTLQEIIAGWLGVEAGSYNQISDSLHVHKDCLEHIHASSPIEAAPNTDVLTLSKVDSDSVFIELAGQIELIMRSDVSAADLLSLTRRDGFPPAIRNMQCVLCGEGVRRRGQPEMAEEIMQTCSNLAYQQLYDRWLVRAGNSRCKELTR